MVVAGDDKIPMHQRSPFGGHDKRSLKRCLKALEKTKAFVLWAKLYSSGGVVLCLQSTFPIPSS